MSWCSTQVETKDLNSQKKGLVKLIKWLLLPLWLQKFKKKGYIPLLDSKKKLIQEYEIIKRQEAVKGEQKKKENNSKRKKVEKVNPKIPKATKKQKKKEKEKKPF